MKKPFALIFCLFSGCLFLAGCTDADWDHMMSYGGMDGADTAPAPAPHPTVAAAPAAPLGEPASADLCRAVAAQDASSNDFDKATQTRVYAQSYAQCLTIYSR